MYPMLKMWTSVATSVTVANRATVRLSTNRPTSSHPARPGPRRRVGRRADGQPPDGITIGATRNPHSPRAVSCSYQLIMARIVQTKLPPTRAVATYPASGLPTRRPIEISTANDASGSSAAVRSRAAGSGMGAQASNAER